MKQRLALAGAILGDPEVLILDEPANGLDPLGIAWLRKFLRSLAGSGRTILVSSHQLAEMQNTVDDVIIMHKGKLITSGSMKENHQRRNPRRGLPEANRRSELMSLIKSELRKVLYVRANWGILVAAIVISIISVVITPFIFEAGKRR